MHIVSGLHELYELEPLPTERQSSYHLNKWKNNYPITYVDYPWSVILNHNIKVDLPKVLNGFVVCQHIDFERLIEPWYEAGIINVFSPHCTKNTHNYNANWQGMKDGGIDVKPYPHFAYNTNQIYGQNQKEYDISFAGAIWTHSIRQEILNYGENAWKDQCRCFVMDTGKWHLEKDKSERTGFESFYSSLMAKSVFSLCPRGTGAGTIRFWEALAHGSIPIVISNGWEPPPSKQYDWDDVIVRVKEDNIKSIPQLIKNLNIGYRSEACKKLYNEFSSWNIINPIKYHFSEIYNNVDIA